MADKRHRASVERKLQDCVSSDKARIELGKLSKFGLLEMSRQRLRSSLISHSHIRCDHCLGNGQIKNPELVALEALRKIQAAVIVGQVRKVKARLPSMPAFFLLNNKRADIAGLEAEHKVQILILPDGRLRPDEYEFEMEGVKEAPAKAAASEETPTSNTGSAQASSNQDSGSGDSNRPRRGSSVKQPISRSA
jgi:ribonuclease E